MEESAAKRIVMDYARVCEDRDRYKAALEAIAGRCECIDASKCDGCLAKEALGTEKVCALGVGRNCRVHSDHAQDWCKVCRGE